MTDLMHQLVIRYKRESNQTQRHDVVLYHASSAGMHRRLKHNVSKGQAKRKSVPKRAVPTKKSAPPAKKKQVAADALRKKALSEGASAADQDAFLKQLASRSLSNL